MNLNYAVNFEVVDARQRDEAVDHSEGIEAARRAAMQRSGMANYRESMLTKQMQSQN